VHKNAREGPTRTANPQARRTQDRGEVPGEATAAAPSRLYSQGYQGSGRTPETGLTMEVRSIPGLRIQSLPRGACK
jgi:hypothetical protein